MTNKINFTKLVPTDKMQGEDQQETSELKLLLQDAIRYLGSFKWCLQVMESYFGIGVDSVVAVFLFRILPSSPDVDEWIWVIVGDLPPGYITTEDSPNPATALDSYIGAMTRWVEAVRAGRPLDDLIPVNAPPTQEYADQLESRLQFLDEEILEDYQDDLKE